MTGFTFSDYMQQTLQDKEKKITSSGISCSDEALKALCQELVSENRLRHYQLEQQERIIKILNDKVEALELHRATQLGQDKIIGFMVGAIVLSLLSLATSLFFKPTGLEASAPAASTAPSQPLVVAEPTGNQNSQPVE